VVTGKRVRPNLYYVTNIEEKPSSPTSNLAAIAVYVFSSRIYSAIAKTTPDANNEVQLTNAIQRLVSDGRSVYALEIGKGEQRVEIGTPESYWRARSLLQRTRALKGNQEGDSHT
jgi:dTDP-glucose pyrophosphorylase